MFISKEQSFHSHTFFFFFLTKHSLITSSTIIKGLNHKHLWIYDLHKTQYLKHYREEKKKTNLEEKKLHLN